MKTEFANGQFTICFGQSAIGKDGKGSGHEDGWRVQFYWPQFNIKNYKRGEASWQRAHKEFYFSAGTNIRLVWEEGYCGAGFNILGFGAAVDWQKQKTT